MLRKMKRDRAGGGSGAALVGGGEGPLSQHVNERFWKGEASLCDVKQECSHLRREGD